MEKVIAYGGQGYSDAVANANLNMSGSENAESKVIKNDTKK